MSIGTIVHSASSGTQFKRIIVLKDIDEKRYIVAKNKAGSVCSSRGTVASQRQPAL